MQNEKVSERGIQLWKFSSGRNLAENIESWENRPLLFLSPYFKAMIYDVIGMTHRKKFCEKNLQMQKFPDHMQEYHFLNCVDFVVNNQNM